MQTPHVRSVLEDLYADLRDLAQERQCSGSAQVILMLEKGLAKERQRGGQGETLAEVRRRRFIPPPDLPGSVELLRQDRER